jgi:hypothetical protein
METSGPNNLAQGGYHGGEWSQHTWDGRPYWYNAKTGVSTWEDPLNNEVKEILPVKTQRTHSGGQSSASTLRRPTRTSRAFVKKGSIKKDEGVDEDKSSTNLGEQVNLSVVEEQKSPPVDPSWSEAVAVDAYKVAESRIEKLTNLVLALTQEKDHAMDVLEAAEARGQELGHLLSQVKEDAAVALLDQESRYKTSTEKLREEERCRREVLSGELERVTEELNETQADLREVEKNLKQLETLVEQELSKEEAGTGATWGKLLQSLTSWVLPTVATGKANANEPKEGAAAVAEAVVRSHTSRVKALKSRARARLAKAKKEGEEHVAIILEEIAALKQTLRVRDEEVLAGHGERDALTKALHEAELRNARQLTGYDDIKSNVAAMAREQERLSELLQVSNDESADLTVRLTILKGLTVKVGEERDTFMAQRDHLAVYYSSLLDSKQSQLEQLDTEVGILRSRLEQTLKALEQERAEHLEQQQQQEQALKALEQGRAEHLEQQQQQQEQALKALEQERVEHLEQQQQQQVFGNGENNTGSEVSYFPPDPQSQQQPQYLGPSAAESWERDYADSAQQGFGHGAGPPRGDEDLSGF